MRKRSFLFLMFLWLTASVGGCTRRSEESAAPRSGAPDGIRSSATQSAGKSAPAPHPTDDGSPSAAVQRIVECRRSGQLGKLRELLPPEQRESILELILAVDGVAAAAEALRTAVSEKIGAASADLFDFTESVNIIDVFSRDVEIIDETVTGDSATVVIQVGRRMPLKQVRLERREGRWLVESDPVPAGLPKVLGDLADALRRTAAGLERHHWKTPQLRKELSESVVPVFRELRRLQSNAEPSPNPSRQ